MSQQSSYQNRNSSAKGAKGAAGKSSPTTHYAYTLVDGKDGKKEKNFVNGLFIYENEDNFGGTYLKLDVQGPIPSGKVFIKKKMAK